MRITIYSMGAGVGVSRDFKVCTKKQVSALNSIFLTDQKNQSLASQLNKKIVENVEFEIDSDGIVRLSPSSVIEIIEAFREEHGLPLLTPEEKNLLLKKDVFNEYMSLAYGVPTIKTHIPSQKPLTGQRFYMVTPEERTGRFDDQMKHYAYRRAIEASGGTILLVDGAQAEGTFHETWPRDLGVRIGDIYYTPDPELTKYQYYKDVEEDVLQFRKVLERENLKIVQVKGSYFEGGQIIVDERSSPKTILFGYVPDPDSPDSVRNSLESMQKFIDQVNATQPNHYDMIAVPLTGYAYHLDVAVSQPLPNGEILVYPPAIGQKTYEQMIARFGRERLIVIDEADAKGFASNLVSVGNRILTMAASPKLRQELESRGYEVIVPVEGPGNDIGAGGLHCAEMDLPSSPPSPQLSTSPPR